MDHEETDHEETDRGEPGGRHRRRRDNSAARAVLDEARRAGLVRRHLTKLRYLAEHGHRPPAPATGSSVEAAEGPASTSDAA